MDKFGERDPLVGWGLATFHAATLVVVLITLLYRWFPVGELLAGLQTSVGLALFLALWATTWWTNHRWLGETRVMGNGNSTGSSSFIRTSFKWGGITGAVFFVVLVTLAFAPQTVPNSLFPLAIVLFGMLVAFAIGGTVGCIFAFIDLVLIRVADRIAR